MPTQIRLTLDTHRRNFRMTQWPITVLDPLDTYDNIVEQAIAAKTQIDTDDNLAAKGKRTAKDTKKDALSKAIDALKTPRLAGLDADVAAHRAALIPANAQKPTDRQIDFLLSHLRDRTPLEIATFYDSATDDEKLVLEEAARSVGRIPTKMQDGSLGWKPLLPAETINESIVARATANNPQGAKKLQELEEIRAMHVSVANLAAAEVNEVLSR